MICNRLPTGKQASKASKQASKLYSRAYDKQQDTGKNPVKVDKRPTKITNFRSNAIECQSIVISPDTMEPLPE